MKKILLASAATAILSGCASKGSVGPMDPLPITHEQAVGMSYAGQAFISEGYVRSGIIVTPGRNWFYGQTDGFRDPSVQTPVTTMQQASEKYGGITHGAYAELSGSGRSSGEKAALASLYHQGLAQGGAMAADSSAMNTPESMVGMQIAHGGTAIPGPLQADQILSYLMRVDPKHLPPILQDRIESRSIPMPLFDFGKTDLKPQYHAQLKAFAKELREGAEKKLLHIHGFTDSIGKEPMNAKIAMGRAKAVHDFLVREGVKGDGLVVTGKPLCCYITPNKTDKDRAQNRRVELRPGGLYGTSNTDPVPTGQMIARVLKTIGGNPHAPIRVIAAAPTHEKAEALRKSLIDILESPAVGMQNLSPGDVAYASIPRLVIEILE